MKCPKCGYEHNSEDALYCGLCYELLKKLPGTAPQGAAPAQSPKPASPILQLALAAGILSGAGVYFYGTSSPAGGQAATALEEVRFRESKQAAENLLLAYNKGREELLTEILKAGIDPGGFGLNGQYMKKLFKLDEDYSNGLSVIRPACPGGNGDEAYSKWCAAFTARETAAMEDFNRKYTQLVKKAGAQ